MTAHAVVLLMARVVFARVVGAAVHEIRAKELESSWFKRQRYMLLEIHGLNGQKLHEDLVPILKEVAQQLHGRATVGTVNTKEDTDLVKKLGADTAKMPALYLYSDGRLLRKWEPVSSWVQHGEAFQDGRVKAASVDDIVEWVDDRMEKAEKGRKIAKRRKEDAVPHNEM